MKQRSFAYLERLLRKKTGQAIHDYRMIEEGDRVMVAVSGGKDSLVLVKILSLLRRAAPVEYELMPVYVNSGFDSGFDRVKAWIEDTLGLDVIIHDAYIREILDTVGDPDKSPCALCSRLRRGHLYSLATQMGADSIALGHHLDDIVETFLLRCFYTGQIGAMAPSRVTDDGKNRIIRPLAYCTSELIDAYFSRLEVEPVTVECPARPDGKRMLVRDYIKRLERDIPRVRYSLFAALGNIDARSLCTKGGDPCGS
ncbi:MAG TPA: ATP-binding protein [Deltaproteobacteria bacterium]|nr:ATP-binding protein [Deltaproteobacteria bacterium]HOM28942.1 ATP-binding protein [Deltaproteobacteria bacterium]HPP80579.1 ATP-binding protein [Deltaproteobacteria bacterium]